MDRIYIPTVLRANDQITLSALPKALREKTILVVQHWERRQYDNVQCEILVLPKRINLHTDYLALAKTREFIHKEAKNTKYCMMDDDITFKRRNAKYATGISDMEKSKRDCTAKDVVEMFKTFSKWLDLPEVTFVSPSHEENPPQNKLFASNAAACSVVVFNGKDFAHCLKELPTSEIRYSEDTLLYLSLLSRGFGNRISQIFCAKNHSVAKSSTLPDTVWDSAKQKDVDRDHRFIEKTFPEFYSVSKDESGKRILGGFRDTGKVKVKWSMCYKSSQK